MGRPPAAATGTLPTPARILDAAEAAFAAQGFATARLEDIAAVVGIRRPSLLHHYATKEALYEAVVRRAFDGLARALGPALADDYAASVDALVSAYLGFLASRPTFAPLVLRETMDDLGPGRELLLAAVAPLLDAVEAFVASRRLAKLRPALPVRAAILQVACAPLVRSAWGPLGAELWGAGPDATPALARALLLPEGR